MIWLFLNRRIEWDQSLISEIIFFHYFQNRILLFNGNIFEYFGYIWKDFWNSSYFYVQSIKYLQTYCSYNPAVGITWFNDEKHYDDDVGSCLIMWTLISETKAFRRTTRFTRFSVGKYVVDKISLNLNWYRTKMYLFDSPIQFSYSALSVGTPTFLF